MIFSIMQRTSSYGSVKPGIFIAATMIGEFGAEILKADDDVVRDNAPQQVVRPVRGFRVNQRNADLPPLGGGAIVIGRPGQDLAELLQGQLQSAIDDIDRVCHLTERQKHKLELIGKRDHARILKQSEPNPDNVQVQQVVNQDQLNQLLRLRQPENGRVKPRLSPDSFFVKSLPQVLTEDQIGRLKEYRRTQLGKSAAAVVSDIDGMVTLTEEQRASIEDKLIEYNLYNLPIGEQKLLASHPVKLLMLYQLSQHVDDDIKTLLTDDQWRKIVVKLKKFASFEAELKARGLIASNKNNEPEVENAENGNK